MKYCKFNAVSMTTVKKEKPKFTTVAPEKSNTTKKTRTKREEQVTEQTKE